MNIEEIVEMRKKLPCKMMVFEGDTEEFDGELYVTEIFNDGSCRCVNSDDETLFLNGYYYRTSFASSCTPIPEVKRRLANRYEWIKWAMTDALDDARNGIVWVVSTTSSGKPVGAGSPVLCPNFGGVAENYWRSKLDENGKPTEWEQFWVEE
jgi:hypothetical protein